MLQFIVQYLCVVSLFRIRSFLCYFFISYKVFMSHFILSFFISYKVFMSHFILYFYLVQGVYVTFYLIFLSRTRCSCHILCYIFYLVHGVHVTFGVSFYLGTDHLICRGELWFFVSFRNMFSDNTRVRIFIFPEFNITLYDKNSESDYFFSSTKIRIFFSATLAIRIFFFRKKP